MKNDNAARISALAVAIITAFPTLAAEDADSNHRLQRLMERVEKLEKRNAELEKTLQPRGAGGKSQLEERLKVLEDRNIRLDSALATEEVSEKEPELASRLKAVEYQALDIQKQAKIIESIEGFSANANFTAVAQRANGIDNSGTQVNYRADITVNTPTIKTGDVESKLFGHFRVGQGKGLSDKFTSFVGPNATSFQLGAVVQPEASAMMLAQAWYQADIPLPFGGFKPQSRETLTVNFGKMDPFAFFDQNTAANDETRQFLASPFVHNALLDNPLAANIGADGFGFSPGMRVSYFNWGAKPETYRLSLGVFGAGRSANFSDSFKSPFIIFQAETSQRLFTGLQGNYRVYLWRNGQAPTFIKDETASHSGLGFNFDQRLGDGITLFGRLGTGNGERLPFDRTVSLGAEFNGSYWDRGADAIGIAIGSNRTSKDFRTQSATVDADGDGIPDYGFAATGWEQVMEAYYRFHVHQRFELTPDFQYIRNPAGNPNARPVKILGVRANLAF
ncbi:carbohydrate porin [Sulfurirhabdus autotrophica]|uniref:Carbohydrate-selective porin OprB n=1 Tax=Sulfurirhabdus autotrophica TaxID=1706046 RepID=A0A4R3XT75_9PROT|nr:carbohydrate porin [Sulfurirhabdus autotrophica]TCV79191.1 carbohydrate-selective porin OprB [Sulfurirhabdus autotrophica]